MLFKGIPTYVVDPDGELSCWDCPVHFLIEKNYVPTDQTEKMQTLFAQSIKVRKWVSNECEDIWLEEVIEEA